MTSFKGDQRSDWPECRAPLQEAHVLAYISSEVRESSESVHVLCEPVEDEANHKTQKERGRPENDGGPPHSDFGLKNRSFFNLQVPVLKLLFEFTDESLIN